jgi:hypothetical protein
MFSESIELTAPGTGWTDPFLIAEELPAKLQKVSVAKLVLGMNRAADVIGGALRRASMSGAIHGRTGMLAKEWILERVSGEPLAWRFINRSPQARILEFGGTIVPKTAGALAVPLSGGPALTERGVPRYPMGPRQAEADGHKLFVLKTAGKAFLAESVGKGKAAKLEMWYILLQSTTIPAFHYASQAVEASKGKALEEVKRALES